jgi:hypothetical protein
MRIFSNISILLFALCVGCSKPSGDDRQDAVRLHPQQVVNVVPASELFEVLRYVPLQTTSDNLIGGINKLEYKNGKYYLYDEVTKSVSCYNRNGSFRFQISALGSGPGQYADVDAFMLSEHFLYLADASKKKILQFDLSGRFVSEHRFPYYYTSAAYIGSDRFVFYSGYHSNTDAEGNVVRDNIIITDAGFHPVSTSLPFSGSIQSTSILEKGRNFSLNGARVLFWYPFSDVIYSVSTDGVQEKFFIDFGSQQQALREKMALAGSGARSSEIALDGGYCDILDALETGTHLYFIYKQGAYYHMVFFNKSNGSVRDLSQKIMPGKPPIPYSNDLDGVPYYPMLTSFGDTIVSYADAFQLIDSGDSFPLLSSVVDSLDENDNPVLILLKLK